MMKLKQKVIVISNVAFEPFFTTIIKNQFNQSNVDLTLFPIPYEEYNVLEYKNQFSISDMIIVWLNLESLALNMINKDESILDKEQRIAEIVALCNNFLNDIVCRSNANILWFTFENYYSSLSAVVGHTYNNFTDKLNLKLFDTIGDRVTFIDLKHIISEVGISNAYDQKNKYRWNSPYSKALIEIAVKEMHKQYLIEKGITKKCLVLDCDNVLWGGVLSEEGVENIKLGCSGFGRPYQDFQRFILSLYYHGVILAVCSKNDLSDVMTMFREHNEMLLKEEHIACFQVNWENKPYNVKRIAETLNIGLDSIVFVDDSPVEVEAVKSILPEVTAILYKRDSVYEGLSCFNLKNDVSIANIEKRNKTYRTNQSRETLKLQYQSYDEYIVALKIKTDIHEALPIEYSRIAELTQRTNKCTNGKRYTITEIKKRIAQENVKLYSLYVSDRFSDLGLVGALEIDKDTLTLFVLSCRAFGRRIEEKMLAFINKKYKISKVEFNSTGKNNDMKEILFGDFI